jgi:hypothetical protein
VDRQLTKGWVNVRFDRAPPLVTMRSTAPFGLVRSNVTIDTFGKRLNLGRSGHSGTAGGFPVSYRVDAI